jgi:glycosyltransferase involved in cell wall biosynthesis
MVKRKLNIAIVCDGVTSTTAGSFISALRFSKILKERGHKVIFITSKKPGEKKIDSYEKIKVYRSFSILLPKSGGQLYLSFPNYFRIKSILKKEKINIVHTMIPTPSSVILIKAAKSLGIKVVAHSHAQPENLFLHFPKFLPIKSINELFYRYMIWIYNKADILICPSKFAERALEKRDLRTEIIIISNGVDILKFRRINNEKFIKKFRIPNDCKKLVFVGRLDPEKKVDTLIKAMPYVLKKYEKVHAIIVGFGNMEKSLKKLVKKLKLGKEITFCGKVSNDEVVMAHSSGDIFILPSLSELEGMSVLESMSCGNPILIANSKESASVDFVDGNGFLFKPEDPKDLAEKALKLLKNEELRESMALRSFENSRHYDINKSVDKLEKLYYSLINGRKISRN